MAELVGEHAQATVLGLDGVVTDEVLGPTDLRAAAEVVDAPDAGAGGAVPRADVPAVRPDGVLVGAGLLALAGVHGLEVVDVAVGLVEVAVAVEVVAVPLVELREVVVDLGGAQAGRELRGIPGVGRVVDERPGAALVLDRVVAVRRCVARHLHPVGHGVDRGVAARGELRVVVLERLAVAVEHLVVVGLVEVGAASRSSCRWRGRAAGSRCAAGRAWCRACRSRSSPNSPRIVKILSVFSTGNSTNSPSPSATVAPSERCFSWAEPLASIASAFSRFCCISAVRGPGRLSCPRRGRGTGGVAGRSGLGRGGGEGGRHGGRQGQGGASGEEASGDGLQRVTFR